MPCCFSWQQMPFGWRFSITVPRFIGHAGDADLNLHSLWWTRLSQDLSRRQTPGVSSCSSLLNPSCRNFVSRPKSQKYELAGLRSFTLSLSPFPALQPWKKKQKKKHRGSQGNGTKVAFHPARSYPLGNDWILLLPAQSQSPQEHWHKCSWKPAC